MAIRPPSSGGRAFCVVREVAGYEERNWSVVASNDVQDQAFSLFDLDDEPELDQAAPVPAPEPTPAIEAAEESVPESVTFDLSTVDGVRAAAEKSEAMRNYLEKLRLDSANAERQRVQNEMRREQGSVERAQATIAALVDRLADGEDPEVLKKELPMYVSANAGWAQAQILSKLAEQAIEMAEPTAQEALRALLERADTPEAVQEVTGHALNAVLRKNTDDTLANLDPESLREHPRFKDWLQSELTKAMEVEMAAQQKQTTIRPNAPTTPSGVAPSSGINPVEFAAMDKAAQERALANLTEEQEDALMTAMYEAARNGQ